MFIGELFRDLDEVETVLLKLAVDADALVVFEIAEVLVDCSFVPHKFR